jgi:hypothetical protein
MTEQILSNAKTNFDIQLNNAITKRNYVSRKKDGKKRAIFVFTSIYQQPISGLIFKESV